jgi:hypothetical protein
MTRLNPPYGEAKIETAIFLLIRSAKLENNPEFYSPVKFWRLCFVTTMTVP